MVAAHDAPLTVAVKTFEALALPVLDDPEVGEDEGDVELPPQPIAAATRTTHPTSRMTLGIMAADSSLHGDLVKGGRAETSTRLQWRGKKLVGMPRFELGTP